MKRNCRRFDSTAAPVQFWPSLGFVPMRYTFYMQQFACGARALHQHAQAGRRMVGEGERDRRRHVYSHQHPYPVDRLQLTTYFNAIAFKSVVRASSLTVWAPVYVWVSLHVCGSLSLCRCVCVCACVSGSLCMRRLSPSCVAAVCAALINYAKFFGVNIIASVRCVPVCVCGCMPVCLCACVCVGCAPFVHFETNKMKHFKVVNMQPIDILAVVCVCGS